MTGRFGGIGIDQGTNDSVPRRVRAVRGARGGVLERGGGRGTASQQGGVLFFRARRLRFRRVTVCSSGGSWATAQAITIVKSIETSLALGQSHQSCQDSGLGSSRDVSTLATSAS